MDLSTAGPRAPVSVDVRQHHRDAMRAYLGLFTGLTGFLFVTAVFAQVDSALKSTGERLVAALPRPSPTAEELKAPCVNDKRIITRDREVLDLLGSRRVYLLAFETWGVKWLPDHASLVRSPQRGCNDYKFLLRQFQRAYGQPELPGWTVEDVGRLIQAVEPAALSLVSQGALPAVLLEPIPGMAQSSSEPIK